MARNGGAISDSSTGLARFCCGSIELASTVPSVVSSKATEACRFSRECSAWSQAFCSTSSAKNTGWQSMVRPGCVRAISCKPVLFASLLYTPCEWKFAVVLRGFSHRTWMHLHRWCSRLRYTFSTGFRGHQTNFVQCRWEFLLYVLLLFHRKTIRHYIRCASTGRATCKM